MCMWGLHQTENLQQQTFDNCNDDIYTKILTLNFHIKISNKTVRTNEKEFYSFVDETVSSADLIRKCHVASGSH